MAPAYSFPVWLEGLGLQVLVCEWETRWQQGWLLPPLALCQHSSISTCPTSLVSLELAKISCQLCTQALPTSKGEILLTSTSEVLPTSK